MDLLVSLDDGEVDCTTSRVTRFCCNVSSWHELLLGQERVEKRSHFVGLWLLDEPHKMVNCLLRAIGIIDHQGVVVFLELTLNICYRSCCQPSHYYFAGPIAVDDLTDEIDRLGISNWLDDSWIDIWEVGESIRKVGRGSLYGWGQGEHGQDQ